MTKPIERAARAACSEWGYSWDHDPQDDQTVSPDGEEVTYCPRPSQAQFRDVGRAAITAYLSPEDEKMVERVRAHIIKSIWPDNFSAEACARAAIAALREYAQVSKET